MNMDIAMTVVNAIQRKPVKNLIYLSSCAVYGEKIISLNTLRIVK